MKIEDREPGRELVPGTARRFLKLADRRYLVIVAVFCSKFAAATRCRFSKASAATASLPAMFRRTDRTACPFWNGVDRLGGEKRRRLHNNLTSHTVSS